MFNYLKELKDLKDQFGYKRLEEEPCGEEEKKKEEKKKEDEKKEEEKKSKKDSYHEVYGKQCNVANYKSKNGSCIQGPIST